MARIDRWQDRDNAALSPLKLCGNSTIVFKKNQRDFYSEHYQGLLHRYGNHQDKNLCNIQAWC